MKKMKTKFSVLFAGIFAIALMAFIPKSTYQDPWPVPDTYKNKVNPLKGNAESLVTGKTLYNQHCKSCHGTKGKGDGPKASQLHKQMVPCITKQKKAVKTCLLIKQKFPLPMICGLL